MINSRHTGMIIWIIKILRRLHDTFYKQNVLSLAFRQRVGVRNQQGWFRDRCSKSMIWEKQSGGLFRRRLVQFCVTSTIKKRYKMKGIYFFFISMYKTWTCGRLLRIRRVLRMLWNKNCIWQVNFKLKQKRPRLSNQGRFDWDT